MANVKSYAWAAILPAAVAIGEDAEVPTPGFIDPASYKTDEAEVVHGGNVLTPEQFTATWDAEFTSVAVTNSTAADWPPGDTLYVTVAGIPFDPASVEDSFAALEARVTNNEAAIAALDSRVAALEAVGTGALAAGGGLGQGPATSHEPKHKGKAEHREDEEHSKPKAKAGEPHWDPSDIDEAEEEDEHGKKGRKKAK